MTPTSGKLEWTLLQPRAVDPGRPEAEILHQALAAEPLVYGTARAAAAAGEPLLIVINDPHRGTRTRVVLETLAADFAAAGLSPEVRVLVATGTHRFDAAGKTRFEQATIAGCGLRVTGCAWHDARDASTLAPLGGELLAAPLVSARFILAIGSVEPHYFAGATGAHKTLAIGCLSHAGIEQNHSGALEPASDVLRLAGNPVYDRMRPTLAALADSRRIAAVNQVTCGERIIAAAAGEPIAALDALLPLVRSVYTHRLDAPVDLAHLRVPPPLGSSLYQADKAFKNNHRAVRDGGGIILDAECPEGIGPDAFMNLLRAAGTYEQAVQTVARRGYRLGDHKAVKLRHLTDPAVRGVHVAIVSRHIRAPDAETAGMRVFADLAPALDWLTAALRPAPRRAVVVEDAGNFCVSS